MWRLCALLLLLANGLYLAWSQGLLRGYGMAPAQSAEPQRLAQQKAAEALRVMGAAEYLRLQAEIKEEQEARQCLQAGPFDALQSQVLRQALEPVLPSGSWTLEEVPLGARWIVYVGPAPSAQGLEQARAELQALGLVPEPLANAALEPGLSLGGFATRPEALALLTQAKARGLRNARVVQERAPGLGYVLKVPAASAALAKQLKAQWATVSGVLGTQPPQPCP